MREYKKHKEYVDYINDYYKIDLFEYTLEPQLDHYDYTLLMAACYHHDYKTVEFLIKNNIDDLNHVSRIGENCLSIAVTGPIYSHSKCKYHYNQVIRTLDILRKAGLDFQFNVSGYGSCLNKAIIYAYRNDMVIKYLIKHGCIYNVFCPYYKTDTVGLMKRFGKSKLLEYYLKHGGEIENDHNIQ